MALPAVLNATGTNITSASTSWAISFPAASAGDLIVVHIGWDDGTTVDTVTPPSGPNGETFTSIAGPVASASTEVRTQAWYTVATGSWSAGTLTFTASAAETCTATTFRVAAGDFDASTPIGQSATRASTGTAETLARTPSMTTGATDGGGLLVWGAVVDADPLVTLTSGWSVVRNQDGGAQALGVASRDTAVTDSESVSEATWSIAGDSWSSVMYVIREVATGGSVDVRVGAVRDSISNLPGIPYWEEYGPLYMLSDPGSAPDNNTTALRFTNITIPQGATITSAKVTVWTNLNQGSNATAWMDIGAEQVDNAAQLSSAANHEARKDNVGTTVQWGPHSGIGSADQPFESPDLSEVVQEIVDRPGWSSGNAIQFFTMANPSITVDYQFRSYYEGVSASYPRLEITWEAASAPVEGAGDAVGEGVAAGDGTTTAFGEGALVGEGVVTGAGEATAVAAGDAVGEGVAAGAAMSTAFGAGAAVGEGVAEGSGVGVALGEGHLVGEGVVAASGSSGILGEGDAVGEGDAEASGLAVAFGSGAVAGEGALAGSALAIAFGEGHASGASDTAGEAFATAFGVGDAVGEGVVVGIPEGPSFTQVSWLEIEAPDGPPTVYYGSGAAIGSGDAAGAAEATAFGSGSLVGEGDARGGAAGIPIAVSWVELEAPTDALGTAVSWVELEAPTFVAYGRGEAVGEGFTDARGRWSSACPYPILQPCDPVDPSAVLGAPDAATPTDVFVAPAGAASSAVLSDPDGCD